MTQRPSPSPSSSPAHSPSSAHSWRHWLLSVSYACLQITLGFLLHPYQTMRGLVKDKYLTCLVLLPIALLALLVFLWRCAVYPLFAHFNFSGGYFTQLIKFTVLFFCLEWQLVIGYLFVKFWPR